MRHSPHLDTLLTRHSAHLCIGALLFHVQALSSGLSMHRRSPPHGRPSGPYASNQRQPALYMPALMSAGPASRADGGSHQPPRLTRASARARTRGGARPIRPGFDDLHRRCIFWFVCAAATRIYGRLRRPASSPRRRRRTGRCSSPRTPPRALAALPPRPASPAASPTPAGTGPPAGPPPRSPSCPPPGPRSAPDGRRVSARAA